MTPQNYGKWTQYWRKVWCDAGYISVADPVWLPGHQSRTRGHTIRFINGKVRYPSEARVLVGAPVPEEIR